MLDAAESTRSPERPTLGSPSQESEGFEIEPPIVLLGEDDDTFRALIAGLLRADGYVVIEAKDGARLQYLVRTLLESGRAPRPELIITDIRMPGMSGLDVLEALRELDWYTPVILMTGFGSDETIAEATELGAAEVFNKPFDLELLRQRVHSVLPIV
ncbi:MAG: response regulator [Polyangiaceae bacterium]|nr:response regulator [Polyangiaceae bacterium]